MINIYIYIGTIIVILVVMIIMGDFAIIIKKGSIRETLLERVEKPSLELASNYP